jgi:hypothetical protein
VDDEARLPLSLDPTTVSRLAALSEMRGMSVEDLVNGLLKAAVIELEQEGTYTD